MKLNRIFKVNIISLIFFIIFYKTTELILKFNDLHFRNFLDYSFKFIILALVIALLVQVILIIYKYMKNNKLKFTYTLTSIIGIILLSIIICWIVSYSSFFVVFSYNPEYVVEKDNTKLVAYVNSFLRVNVDYYEYINPFLRGNTKLFTESYGKGGFDPFKMDPMPDVENTTYH